MAARAGIDLKIVHLAQVCSIIFYLLYPELIF